MHFSQQVKLHLYLPCRDQDKGWSKRNKEIFNHIKEHADDIIYVSEMYVPGCMHARNRRMVEDSHFCIAYITRNSGGTAYTVDYAESCGLKVIRL